jgi:hypothetical protein
MDLIRTGLLYVYDHSQLFVISVGDIPYRVHPDAYCELIKRR